MVAILTLLFALALSILVTRIATIALVHTGLSRESARFQARSAFTGAGFTTTESERVVNHPVRRRIVMLLMLLGNAGFVTMMSSVIVTFTSASSSTPTTLKVVFIALGITTLWLLSASKWVDRRLSAVIDRALRRFVHLDTKDYASLMQLVGDYRLVELRVREDDWLSNKTLAELELRDEGVIVLGIKHPDGKYQGAPNGDSYVGEHDTLLVYGRGASIERIDQRRKSMTAEVRHDRAVQEERDRRKEETEFE